MMRTIAFAAAILAFSHASIASNEPKPAPDVTLVDDAGRPVRLADLKGHVVLVDFWASWCIPCRTSFPAIDAMQHELGGRGLVVLAVNVDEQRRNAEAFLAARSHTMRIAFDPRGQAAEAFALQAMPSTVVLDKNGRIRFSHMGYTEKTIEQYRAEVLQLLGEPE